MQKYPQILINLRTSKKVNIDANETIQKCVKDFETKLGDKGRILLRASGTEPLIRVMVEGEQEDTVKSYANQIAEVVKKAIDA
jgi:phosphoglucosamine mutase